MLELLFAATLSASTPSPTPRAVPTTSVQPDGFLTGAWAFGSANEPKAGATTMDQPCYGADDVIHIAQSGEQVTIDYTRPQPPHGAVFAYEPFAGEHSEGTFDGAHLVASGSFDTGYGPTNVRFNRNATPPPGRGTHTPVDYDLRLDAKSGHLVGTRSGAPYWAARVTFTPRKTPCPPPPP